MKFCTLWYFLSVYTLLTFLAHLVSASARPETRAHRPASDAPMPLVDALSVHRLQVFMQLFVSLPYRVTCSSPGRSTGPLSGRGRATPCVAQRSRTDSRWTYAATVLAISKIAQYLGGTSGAASIERVLSSDEIGQQVSSEQLALELHGNGAHRSLRVTAKRIHELCEPKFKPGIDSTAKLGAVLGVPPELLFNPFELTRSSFSSRGVNASVHGHVDIEVCVNHPFSGSKVSLHGTRAVSGDACLTTQSAMHLHGVLC
jgi:hypothetical protein